MKARELRAVYVTVEGAKPPTVIRQSSGAAAFFVQRIGSEACEVFALIGLDTKSQVIAYHEVSRGTLDSTLVHPREVYKAALLMNAAAVIVAHNHPSGDPTPSPDDIAMQQRLVAAGTLVGVELLDAMIVCGNGRYYSARDKGVGQ